MLNLQYSLLHFEVHLITFHLFWSHSQAKMKALLAQRFFVTFVQNCGGLRYQFKISVSRQWTASQMCKPKGIFCLSVLFKKKKRGGGMLIFLYNIKIHLCIWWVYLMKNCIFWHMGLIMKILTGSPHGRITTNLTVFLLLFRLVAMGRD